MDSSANRVRLKRCIEEACTRLRVRFGDFASTTGLNDFLLDIALSDPPVKDVAVRALTDLCDKDAPDYDAVVCVAIIQWLDEVIGAPKEDPRAERRMRDLFAAVRQPCSAPEYANWVDSWYGR